MLCTYVCFVDASSLGYIKKVESHYSEVGRLEAQ